MKKLKFNQMDELYGNGWWNWNEPLKASDIGCGVLGLAAGIASGFNPIVGGLTALGCMLTL